MQREVTEANRASTCWLQGWHAGDNGPRERDQGQEGGFACPAAHTAAPPEAQNMVLEAKTWA